MRGVGTPLSLVGFRGPTPCADTLNPPTRDRQLCPGGGLRRAGAENGMVLPVPRSHPFAGCGRRSTTC